jgi:hypothetical protein
VGASRTSSAAAAAAPSNVRSSEAPLRRSYQGLVEYAELGLGGRGYGHQHGGEVRFADGDIRKIESGFDPRNLAYNLALVALLET